MSHTRTILLNPGPVTLSERVRQAMLGPDLCHREPEFTELQAEIRARLASVYPEARSEYVAVLFTGSGTAAVEAMVGSLVPDDGKALVAANGVYGDRIAAMLQVRGAPHDVIRTPWTEAIPLAEVEKKLQSERFTHLIAVHHETTTGRLNDLNTLGQLARQYDVKLLVDAVSSFGGESIDFASGTIEACAATANKCLHGVPGISFVVVRKETIATRTSAARNLYLDVIQNGKAQDKGHPLFTPSVQVLYALREALLEFDDEGGWQARRDRYRQRMTLVRDGLHRRRIASLLSEGESSILSAFLLPDRVPFANLYQPLKRRGFVIYPGQHWLDEKIFRIAVMGDLQPADLTRFLDAFDVTLADAPRR